MKVLIFGAGVIGTVFAWYLYRGGNEVTVLARGRRLAELREHGLIVHNCLTGETSFCTVKLIEELLPEDEFDLIVVPIPKNAIRAALPILAKNVMSRSILFMVNTTEGYDEWIGAIGRDRVLIGFPGAGGTFSGPTVRYALTPAWMQQTTIGELDGSVTERLIEVVSVFRLAGIPTTYCHDMHAWQLTHAAVILPISGAISMAGSVHLLPLRRDVLVLAIDAIREGLRVLKSLQISITPDRMNKVLALPRPILVSLLSYLCKTGMFVTVTAHAREAREELCQLSEEFRKLAAKSKVPTPALDKLISRFAPLTQAVRTSAA